MKLIKKILIFFFLHFKVDLIVNFFKSLLVEVKRRRLSKLSGCNINFVKQGSFDFNIIGDLKKFKIHSTSSLKSDALIECTGGVEIGRYFHVGKGLTIFSASHNWNKGTKIPYDEKIILKKVKIGDFVWVGANVTILPGVIIGDGAIIAGGSVVTKNVKALEVVGGNPARVITSRNEIDFNRMKDNKMFF